LKQAEKREAEKAEIEKQEEKKRQEAMEHHINPTVNYSSRQFYQANSFQLPKTAKTTVEILTDPNDCTLQPTMEYQNHMPYHAMSSWRHQQIPRPQEPPKPMPYPVNHPEQPPFRFQARNEPKPANAPWMFSTGHVSAPRFVPPTRHFTVPSVSTRPACLPEFSNFSAIPRFRPDVQTCSSNNHPAACRVNYSPLKQQELSKGYHKVLSASPNNANSPIKSFTVL